MTGAEVLARARSAIGRRTVYALGRGGRDPLAVHPADKRGRCDCSGFAAWACGLDRHQPRSALEHFNGGWLSTSGIVWTARNGGRFFAQIDAPEPGDLVVYGDRKVKGVTKQGHVGIVSAATAGLRVVHCAKPNYVNRGDAILDTDGAFFLARGAIFVRLQ